MTESNKPQKSMQLQLWLMVGIVVGVMLAGYLTLPKDEEERQALLANLGTTNHGNLISPLLPLDKLALSDEQGQSWRHGEQKPKWRMLIPGDANCLEACRGMVYTSRQVHLRLGKYTSRFERLYIATAKPLSDAFRDYLEDHHYLHILHTSATEWQAWLQQAGVESQEGMAVLVDQNGNAMMYYSPGSSGGDMLEDINHLLKYSPE